MTERSVKPSTSPQTGPDSAERDSSTSADVETTRVATQDETAVRPGFAERLQAKLAAATPGGATASDDSDAVVEDRPQRGPRRARLRLTRIDPWSVMKTSFLLAIAFGVVTVVAVAMIWGVLGAAGVWDSINDSIRSAIGGQETANFDVEDYVGTTRVLGLTMIVAAVDVILITAIATLAAFLYNMSAALLGGVEVTLAEED